MKNYKIKSIILAGVACLGLSSCGDFLNIEPKTFVSEDNFWNEKTDIDQMVAGTYVKMQSSDIISRCIVWGELRSDNLGEGLNCSGQTDLYRALRCNLLSTNRYCEWQSFYSVINQCNIVIARAPEVSEKDPTYTQSNVLATQAEMAFLRDLCYFYLVRAFKDVPYYTYPIQTDEDAQPIGVTDGDEIVKALIADLEGVVSNALKAYPKDNNRNYNSNCNRVTQNAIYALLADLCLWDGQYQKCIDYSQRVIDAKLKEYKEEYATNTTSTSDGSLTLFKSADDPGEGYPLYPCFSGNYFGNDFGNIFSHRGNSFESIFELAFTTDGTDAKYIGNTSVASLYGNYYNTGSNNGQGYLCVHEQLAEDPKSSKRVFLTEYDCRYYTGINKDESSTGNSSVLAYPAKFVAEEMQVEAVSNTHKATMTTIGGNYANHNWIFYRLTDVMLMQAEALIESAKYDDFEASYTDDEGIRQYVLDEDGNRVFEQNYSKAFWLIFAVNRRSIMTSSATANHANQLKPAQYVVSRSTMRELCMDERRRELLFEGKRWFDLLRRCHREGNITYISGKVPAKSGGAKPVNYENLFWPYNKYDVKNNPLLKQKAFYGEDDEEGNYKSTK